MSTNKLTSFVDLVDKYLKAEQQMWATNTAADTFVCFRLRDRLEREIEWINKQRARSLLRKDPEFSIK